MNELETGQAGASESEEVVILVRGGPVMLASLVAQAFGVQTREVIQTVKRNPLKFRDIHAFELTGDEVEFLTSQDVISKPGRGGSRALPWVFTQKGIVRLAMIMNAPAALEATDRVIDLFIGVQTQLARGRTQIAISHPSQILPDVRASHRIGAFREKLLDALEGLLGTVIDPRTKATVRDELEEVGGSALDYLKAHLRKKGLENERIEAETIHILEKVREIRARTEADVHKSAAETEKINLENLDKKIAIVEKLLQMADAWNPTPSSTCSAISFQQRGYRHPNIAALITAAKTTRKPELCPENPSMRQS
jgi:hypothetical protein